MQASGSCEFTGWAPIDLDDPAPNRAYKICRQLECCVEDFIEQAIEEKLARMDAEGGVASLKLGTQRGQASPGATQMGSVT